MLKSKNEPANFCGGGRTACSLASGFFGRWIRWQRPLPAAGGEMKRLANDPLRT